MSKSNNSLEWRRLTHKARRDIEKAVENAILKALPGAEIDEVNLTIIDEDVLKGNSHYYLEVNSIAIKKSSPVLKDIEERYATSAEDED